MRTDPVAKQTVGAFATSCGRLIAAHTLVLLLLGAAACSDDDPTRPVYQGIQLTRIVPSLGSSGYPVHLTAPAGDPRLFVTLRSGVIEVVRDGELTPRPFLDLTSQVGSDFAEQGMLSTAFHPNYEENGYFYVYYTDLEDNTRVERYSVGEDPDVADANSAELILEVEQPNVNHNGGLIRFGPDGYLYIGLGDGGGDWTGAQDPGTLLGTLLRIDVDGGSPYAAPPDNPFVGTDEGRDEVWAYGLRNPWQYAFDQETGTLFIADVGWLSWEEINAVPSDQGGLNFGWPLMEGLECHESDGCDDSELQLPDIVYSLEDPDACAVIGGAVYRGEAIPSIQGTYFYSDNCGGWIRSFRYSDGEVVDEDEWDLGSLSSVSSFGTDGAGELYVVTANGVYALEPAAND